MNFSLGINYWPGDRAMYWWSRFDADSVARDFARIRRAGFDSVRIFLLWEDFQPSPDQVSPTALRHLVEVADAAARHHLRLIPTLFTGHMSGVNWIPEWALADGGTSARFPVVARRRVVNAGPKNWYADETVGRAQARLARAAAAVLAQHPALWAWDLGNENSNCVVPPSRAAGVAWLARMAEAIRSVDRAHPITIGLHMEDLEEDRKIGPSEAARVCDFLCMHGYPLYAEWADSPTDAHLLPFLGLITRWLGGRDVLFEEFGAPTLPPDAEPDARPGRYRLLAEPVAARFTRDALDLLHQFGFLGAMLWCYSDYDPSLWHAPPLDEAAHERYFGLWRAPSRGEPAAKPALAEIKPWAGAPRRPPVGDFSWVGMAWEDFYKNPRENLRRLYRQFRRLDFGFPPLEHN